MCNRPQISALALAQLLELPPPTPEQIRVIEAAQEPAAVIAGAGSGKTETMAARVIWLVANRLTTPEQILGLTFTRKAAAELASRIRRRIARLRWVLEHERATPHAELIQLQAGEPTVLTYAAYAGRLVSEQGLRLGVEPDTKLLTTASLWQLADGVVRGWKGPLGEFTSITSLVHWVLKTAATLDDHLVTPAELERFAAMSLEHFWGLPKGERARSETPNSTGPYIGALEQRVALVPLVQRFIAAKASQGAVDFGDQMRIAARLAALPAVAATERERFAVVLLDEYQDTGHAQIQMLSALFAGGHPVTAVGDPLQSIYGWRGASAGNMAAFAENFHRSDGTPAAVYPLLTSFRNDRSILHSANRIAIPLRPGHGTGELRAAEHAAAGEIQLAFTETVEDEATWVAAQIAIAWETRPVGARTAAVLVRRRSQIPVLATALAAAGLPVEVLGLGGLLSIPEVTDIVATLRVLAEYRPNSALLRLLTGARWRIGASDLAALRDRSRELVRNVEASESEDTERASLLEALDDLGAAVAYSTIGYSRLSQLAAELSRLRRCLSSPLPELINEICDLTGLEVELLTRAESGGVARVHLDKLIEVAANFAAETGRPSLRAFLAYLDAAKTEEYGLAPGEVVVQNERVQLLTVHGAKGLEWQIVAVTGLASDLFPARARAVDWVQAREELPDALRGDQEGQEVLDLTGAASRNEVGDLLSEHHDRIVARHALEERRLAYVAFTRAKSVLIASGYAWDSTIAPRSPSPFLTALRAEVPPQSWFEPEPAAVNPRSVNTQTALWPSDPLAPIDGEDALSVPVQPGEMTASSPRTRASMTTAAALVRDAIAAPPEPTTAENLVLPNPGSPFTERSFQWQRDVSLLLAEREQLLPANVIKVPLPAQLSVSQLVALGRDENQFARRLHRPMPTPPTPATRRGTTFHEWLEQRWAMPALLDLDELPGAADDWGDQEDELAKLRTAFMASIWATRTPAQIEVPFEMAFDGLLLRGRIDAVFGSAAAGWTVVDWKTGARPHGAAAKTAAIQLGVYRLAWARLVGLADHQVENISAAFHYVSSNETVRPVDLLGLAGLRELIACGG